MSLIRSLLSLGLAFLFVTLTFTAVTSYTIGNLLIKENLKEFVETELAPKLITEQCNWFCQMETLKEECIDLCISESLEQIDQRINEMIEDFYSREIFGITIDQISTFVNQTQLFSFIAIVCLILITKIAENPINIIGKSLLTAGISLSIAGLSPNMIVGSSIGGMPVLSDMFSYLSEGLELQMKIGMGLLVLGIILLIAEKVKERK